MTRKKTHKNHGEKGREGVLGDFIYKQNNRNRKKKGKKYIHQTGTGCLLKQKMESLDLKVRSEHNDIVRT